MTLTFRPRHRLQHNREFASVYAARLRAQREGFVLHARANELAHPRLGLSIGKRMGNAVARNRFKRLLRESFRLSQHELPPSTTGFFDYVVVLHPHEEQPLAWYMSALTSIASELALRQARAKKPR